MMDRLVCDDGEGMNGVCSEVGRNGSGIVPTMKMSPSCDSELSLTH